MILIWQAEPAVKGAENRWKVRSLTPCKEMLINKNSVDWQCQLVVTCHWLARNSNVPRFWLKGVITHWWHLPALYRMHWIN
jgi:hypothetical protein